MTKLVQPAYHNSVFLCLSLNKFDLYVEFLAMCVCTLVQPEQRIFALHVQQWTSQM